MRGIAHFRADLSFAIIDAFLISLAYLAALELRFVDSTGVPENFLGSLLAVLPIVILVHMIFSVSLGTYGHVWEYASIAEAKQIAIASMLATATNLALLLAARSLFNIAGPIPISTVVMGGLIALFGMGLVRFRSRLFSFRKEYGVDGPERTLVIGTGRAAADFARFAPHAARPTEVVGFVSIDTETTEKRLAGLPVVGSLATLDALVDHHRIDQVVVAGGGGSLARRVLDLCMNVDVDLRIIPEIEDILTGESPSADVRDLAIRDLLPRPTVSIDLEPVAQLVAGKRVLVTGAGGSIGSEVVRQLLAFDTEVVYALDRDESALHEAMLTWSDTLDQAPEQILCDIRDTKRVGRAFDRLKPEIVFHAAALKHVPILQDHPDEAVKTNVVGTSNVIDAGRRNGMERFVLISTDKAVAPSSIMGATKRLAEMLVQSADARRDGCRYSSVRFGNVLGSRGSVVPTFISQIQKGGPVTLTDPNMTRYFMTINEAVQLVLQASAMADGGEVFVLDMGEPVRIGDLAHRMIRLAGLVPGRDIEIKVVGRRPGEKMREILSWEPLAETSHPQVQVTVPGYPGPVTVMDTIDILDGLSAEGDTVAISRVLRNMTCQTWKEDASVDLRSMEEGFAAWN